MSTLIKFKRGLQADLNTKITNKTGEDGTFYLTTDADSARLYVGKADGAIVPVNQGIITVANTAALSNGTLTGTYKAGDFAYVTEGNILAVYSGTGWVQINTAVDTYIESITYNVSIENGKVTVQTAEAYNNGGGSIDDSFTITGTNGITASVSGKDITLTGDRTKISSAVSNNTLTISAKGEDNTDNGSVALTAGSNIQIVSKDGGATISATDSTISGVDINAEATGFKITVSDSENHTAEDTIQPKIAYGENATPVDFVNGTATLAVYSKADIDTKLKDLDALVYKGTVGTNGSSAPSVAAITTAQAGYTYKASSDFSLTVAQSATDVSVDVKAGDLLIATGTEDTDGNLTTIKFNVIPSGNDTDTTYTFTATDNGMTLTDTVRNTPVGNFNITGATSGLITVSSTKTGDDNTTNTISLAHDSIATNATTGDAVTVNNGTGSFTAITGLTADGKGHITGYTTQAISITDSQATLDSVTYAASANSDKTTATVTNTTTLGHGTKTADTQTGSFSIGSSTMEVSGSGSAVTMDMVWGTF